MFLKFIEQFIIYFYLIISSILPFIRQYRIANIDWFDERKDISKVQIILNNFLNSELFAEIMKKYDVWEEGDNLVYFPVKNL